MHWFAVFLYLGQLFLCRPFVFGWPCNVCTVVLCCRVAALRARVVAVAAGNKHSVAVSSAGDLFTWGGNELGQLGYGTSDSTANANPRLVEAMKVRFGVEDKL